MTQHPTLDHHLGLAEKYNWAWTKTTNPDQTHSITYTRDPLGSVPGAREIIETDYHPHTGQVREASYLFADRWTILPKFGTGSAANTNAVTIWLTER